MRNILLLLLVSFALFTYSQQRDIELTDIWASGTFYPKTIGGFVNMNDGKSYCVQEQNTDEYDVINQYDYISGKLVKEIVSAADVFRGKKIGFTSYTFNADQSIILLYYNSTSIYRNSSRGDFVVIDLIGNIQLGNGEQVRYPTMNSAGDMVAYVKGNNLYTLNLTEGKTKQITKDGEYNTIINGAVDWVYEEEFAMSRGFEWNADGTQLAFYRFDESAVKQWQMTTYGKLYPDYYRFKYPKAGEANSIVDVYIADAAKGKCHKLELGSENDQYLPRIKWTKDPNVLSVQRLNRLQNKWELLMVTGTAVELAVEEKNKYYVEITDEVYFLADGMHMIVSSESGGYKHLYFHKVNGPQIYQITKGDWEVTSVLGIDDANETIYFTSTEVESTERHIYSIDFQGKNKKRLTKETGWHTAQFSKDFSLVLHSFTTATSPHVYTIKNNVWETQRVVEDNQAFVERNAAFKQGEVVFDKLTVNGTELNYWIIKPVGFVDTIKYPVLMHVYGGPGSQTVKNSFGYSNHFWHQMLANKHNIIIVSVDNRGTGAKGEEFKKMTYKQLGKYETEDQIEAAKELAKLSYVDGERIGIWGWSYGGYMSSLALAKGNDVFKMAIAVAPVSNWRFYDNIYTERYMALPKDNAEGYDNNSPINFVKDIKGKYLIIHGTGDDNVHFQNSVMMVDELIKNNIPFDSEYYPNKNHGIYGGYTRLHLYTKMTNFILENL
ncbi:MAG: DPP IV N-terminal domain-containing protein [Bacteroidia bacterium]|jgi:dipeptidyl-peptidase-4|nr:DPP IV N-terminal domain-containing protein [Bacteroidia bacterium]